MDRRDFLMTTAAAAAVTLPAPMAEAARAEFNFSKKMKEINGSRMAYVDEGQGRPVVFLHGNPTSSYLWRNIIPAVTGGHRAIAPDLIGMGDSDKPDVPYTYGTHAKYLFGLLDALDLEDAVLVVHDWGSALGFDYARQNPGRVSAIAFMEAMLPPVMPFESLASMGPFEELFRTLRAEGPGEKMVLMDNFFVEVILREMGVKTRLSDEVMVHYRKPFDTPISRMPTLQWPREIPISGEPAETDQVIRDYGDWFLTSDMPKLMLTVEPGALIPPQAADWLKANLSNLEAVHLGEGAHFLQEDYPIEIGMALSEWLDRI